MISSPPPSIAAGSYTYKSSLNGAPTGTTTIVVKRNGDTTEIDERSAGNIGGIDASATAALTLGADLSPTAYSGSYQGGGQAGKDSVSFSGATAVLTSALGPQSFDLLAPAKHFTVIDAALLAGFVALPAQMQAWSGSPILAVVPVYGRCIALAPKGPPPVRPAGVPATDVSISMGGPYPFNLWYDPATYIADELDVPSQNIVSTRVR